MVLQKNIIISNCKEREQLRERWLVAQDSARSTINNNMMHPTNETYQLIHNLTIKRTRTRRRSNTRNR